MNFEFLVAVCNCHCAVLCRWISVLTALLRRCLAQHSGDDGHVALMALRVLHSMARAPGYARHADECGGRCQAVLLCSAGEVLER